MDARSKIVKLLNFDPDTVSTDVYQDYETDVLEDISLSIKKGEDIDLSDIKFPNDVADFIVSPLIEEGDPIVVEKLANEIDDLETGRILEELISKMECTDDCSDGIISCSILVTSHPCRNLKKIFLQVVEELKIGGYKFSPTEKNKIKEVRSLKTKK